jgi:hypothetical protein
MFYRGTFMMNIFMKSRSFVKSFASLFLQGLIFSGTLGSDCACANIRSGPPAETAKEALQDD